MTLSIRSSFTACAIALATAALPASALTAQQSVEREVVVQNPDGTQTVVREPASEVAPGDQVVYRVDFTNDTSEAASDIVLTQPVPAEVLYVEGSADTPGMEVSVSVDGGESFGPRGAVTVVRDGEPVRADASDITHIRWTLVGELAPSETGAIAYKGVLK